MNHQKQNNKDRVQVAFDLLEHVFSRFNNDKNYESNKHSLGDPNRKEHDLSELEKAHLDLLRARLDMEISEKQTKSFEKISKSQGNLQKWTIGLTALIAFATVIYVTITWQSVKAMNKANSLQAQTAEIMQEANELQKQSIVAMDQTNKIQEEAKNISKSTYFKKDREKRTKIIQENNNQAKAVNPQHR